MGITKDNRTVFKSLSCEWATPQNLFDQLNEEFGFTLDVCATPENAKCDRFFTIATSGLMQKWKGVCWMNPPYGPDLKKWMAKAWEQSQQGATVVCLVPARTDTAWWHDFALKGEIRFLRGRLRFGDTRSPAPFPSAVIVLRPADKGNP